MRFSNLNKIAISLSPFYFIVLLGCNLSSGKSDGLTVADGSIVWWMAPSIIAKNENLYEKSDLNVQTFNVLTGLASKNAVLSGTADVGLVASAPLALAAFKKENLIVLCSYIESKNLIALVSPVDDTSAFPLPKQPVAIVKGTISEFYFYNYLRKHFPSNNINDINEVSVQPSAISNTLRSKSANSAFVWEPWATIAATTNAGYKITRSDDIYDQRIYIVTTPEVLRNKRSALEKFVNSIQVACDKLKNNSSEKEWLIKHFANEKPSIDALFDKVDFSLKFDYEHMKELILSDADVAYSLGQTPKDETGKLRKLSVSDIQYYFGHDFKKN